MESELNQAEGEPSTNEQATPASTATSEYVVITFDEWVERNKLRDQLKAGNGEMEKVKEENRRLKDLSEKRDDEVVKIQEDKRTRGLKARTVKVPSDLNRLTTMRNQQLELQLENELLKRQVDTWKGEKEQLETVFCEKQKEWQKKFDEMSQRLVSAARDYYELATKKRKLEAEVSVFNKIKDPHQSVLEKTQIEAEKLIEEVKLLLSEKNEAELEKEQEWRRMISEMSEQLVKATGDFQRLAENNRKLEAEVDEFRKIIDDQVKKQMMFENKLTKRSEKEKEQCQCEENQTQEKQQDEVMKWKWAKNGYHCPDAVAGGNERNGLHITYVGRVLVHGQMIPAKIVPKLGCCFAIDSGKELIFTEYEYLVKPSFGTLIWKLASDGRVPTDAVIGGRNDEGEPLYFGRANFDDHLIVCKLQSSPFQLQFPWLKNTSDDIKNANDVIISEQIEVLCLVYD